MREHEKTLIFKSFRGLLQGRYLKIIILARNVLAKLLCVYSYIRAILSPKDSKRGQSLNHSLILP